MPGSTLVEIERALPAQAPESRRAPV